ncbi:MAG: class I tRNA ligase family protein, partial [Armatimonadota bacterium]
SDQGIEGVFRFLNRVWRLFDANLGSYDPAWREGMGADLSAAERKMRRKTHQTIQKVTFDIERFHFNTAVSALMEMLNEMYAFRESGGGGAVLSEAMENLALILGAFVPHLADELWEQLGKSGSTYEAGWPAYDPGIAKAEEVTVVLQVNGKLRDKVQVPAETERAALEAMALANEKVVSFMEGKPVKKVIIVPGKLVNVVV